MRTLHDWVTKKELLINGPYAEPIVKTRGLQTKPPSTLPMMDREPTMMTWFNGIVHLNERQVYVVGRRNKTMFWSIVFQKGGWLTDKICKPLTTCMTCFWHCYIGVNIINGPCLFCHTSTLHFSKICEAPIRARAAQFVHKVHWGKHVNPICILSHGAW